MITIPEIPDIANKTILDPAGGLGESLLVMLNEVPIQRIFITTIIEISWLGYFVRKTRNKT